MTATAARGLGKGLSALMGEGASFSAAKPATPAAAEAAPGEAVSTLPVVALVPGKYQPRRHFDEESLAELTDSVEKHGIMQPLVVRQLAAGSYEIIAGERRFRAAKLAKLTHVPVIIRTVDDSTALELALIENVQRADLNPLEEAAGYQRLMEEFSYTQEKLAPVVGKSRSHIANLLRLLKLPDSIKKRIDSGELTMGHARALLMAENPEDLAQKIVAIGLSVRQAEDLAKGIEPKGESAPAPQDGSLPVAKKSARGAAKEKSDDVRQLESMLADNLGLSVSINASSGQAGEVVIRYESLMQLDEILRRLGGNV